MLGIVLLILGAVGKIIQANEWFIIPDAIIKVMIIGGGVILVIQIIAYIIAARKVKKFQKKHFGDF